MLTFRCNEFAPALIALAVVPVHAGGKPYQNSALAQAVIELEAQVRHDAATVTKPVTERQPQFGSVILADYLPADFEIGNPHLVSSGNTGKLPWLTDAATPVHSGFRDDRFTRAFERNKNSPVLNVAYVVRAVSPGHYVLQQAFIEDTYPPDRFGRTATGTIHITAAK